MIWLRVLIVVLLVNPVHLLAQEIELPPEGVGHEHDDTSPNPFREKNTPIQTEQARQMATRVIAVMVKRGELAPNWVGIREQAIDTRLYKGDKEWIVTYHNPQEKNPGRQTMYVFLDIYGDVIDVNYTGK